MTDLEAEVGWVAIKPLAQVGSNHSFVSSDPLSNRIRVRYFKREPDGALVGKVWFGPAAEGPPGHAHGGSMAAVLDEALGAVAWMSGYPVLSAKLTTVFRRMLPLQTIVFLEARIITIEDKKVSTSGRLTNSTGECFAEAEGTFVRVSVQHLRKLGAQATRGCAN